ncbi:MAG: nitrogenase iron-molybdenum cofactor biosynthesis protein NifE [Planctomycetota bacterium]|nr:MAG: nitrogenase iron-molybdenum cofactor biosynthesis protein NifE [Planctomycetota bacterium]
MSQVPLPISMLDARQGHAVMAHEAGQTMSCEKHSAAGAVSQRACVFCGSRVVLYPISDAVHLVHGPIGCASYTWDIRGSLSSGPQLHRLSFATDMREDEVIHGGEPLLKRALADLIPTHQPNGVFVYGTCLAGLIGDDIEAICREATAAYGIPVIPVEAPGFGGTKKTGYKVACEALGRLVGQGDTSGIAKASINILGDFNLAGETWDLRRLYEAMGIEVVATITGDGRIGDIQRAHGAALNVVQCSGSMTSLARDMESRFGIPFKQVSYVGMEDTAEALYTVAKHFGGGDYLTRAQEIVVRECASVMPELKRLRKELQGKTAAIYTGGAFKAISLVRSLRALGMRPVLAGSQTGGGDDYEALRSICDDDTLVVDDLTAGELAAFCRRGGVDLLIGGVKERPIALKLGIAFCDHNHERKHALAAFSGMLSFAREVHASLTSPVWDLHRLPMPGGQS